jgi:hypothetical protein
MKVWHEKRKPWDVTIPTTKVGLERCMRALLLTGSHMTSHFRLGDFDLGRGISAFLRVQIPEGLEDRFRELAQPEDMHPPSKINL